MLPMAVFECVRCSTDRPQYQRNDTKILVEIKCHASEKASHWRQYCFFVQFTLMHMDTRAACVRESTPIQNNRKGALETHSNEKEFELCHWNLVLRLSPDADLTSL